MAKQDSSNGTGTGTALPGADTGTQCPGADTGTQCPDAGTGTQCPDAGTGTGLPGTGTQYNGGNQQYPKTGNAPLAQGQLPHGSSDNIQFEQQYTINGITYNSIRPINKKSGEAKVIIVENGGNKFCLKIYIAGHTPNDVAVLNKVQSAQGGFLVNLRDHGQWRDPNTGITHYYEVMDYAEYGALDTVQITSPEHFRKIVLRMATCIAQCHKLNIVHRDVKPENFLCTSADHNEFVLTDFGIAGILKPGQVEGIFNNAKSSHFVSVEASMSADNRISTVGYAADFYSMGMTLLSMLMGMDDFYKINATDLLKYKRQNTIVDKLKKFLNFGGTPLGEYELSLLRALLQSEPENRAGYDDIKTWYTSRQPLTKGANASAATPSASAQGSFSVTFDDSRNLVAHSPEELAKFMLANMDYAKEFVYRGLAKSGLERTGKVSLAMGVDRIVEQAYPDKDDREAGVYAVALLLDANMPFIGLSGAKCTSPDAIKDEIWNNRAAYAKNLAKHGATLWAYFAARGTSEVKALESRFRQLISRAGEHGVYALCRVLDPNMPFYSLKGKPITSQKEIAAELWNNRSTYVTALANSDHSLWVYLSALGANGQKIASEYPSRIRNGGESDLFTLCSILDKDTPYVGKKQAACRTEKELADELWAFLADYKKELADPRHLFWKYLELRGASWAKIAHDYPALIKQNADVWTFELVYRLDPTKPYVIQYADDKKWHHQFSVDDIIKNVAAHGITDFSLSMLCKADFQTWLTLSSKESDRKCGALLAQMVKTAGNAADKKGWFYLYNFAPSVDLAFTPNGDLATTVQIGAEINRQYQSGFTKKAKVELLPMLKKSEFAGSRLCQYMEARKMQSYVSGIQAIIDINKNERDHPSAPYNQAIALWKVIQYLGHTPTYTFSNMRTVSTLGEIRALPSSLLNNDINKGLADYLTIFFHERKGAAFSFDELEKYYDFIETYAPQHTGMSNSASERTELNEAISNRNNAWRGLSWWRNAGVWLGLAPLLGVLAWMIWMTITGDASAIENVVKSIGEIAGVVMAIVGACVCAAGGLFGLAIGGILGYWIGYGIFYLLSVVAVYIIALILLAIGITLVVNLFSGSRDDVIKTQSDYDSLLKSARIYKVCTALGTAYRTFSSNINPQDTFERSYNKARSYRRKVVGISLGMILLAGAAFGLGVLLRNKTENYVPEQVEEAQMPITAEDLQGEWEGLFHERKATFVITEVSGNEVAGYVDIQYSTPMHHDITGVLNGTTLRFNVDGKSGVIYDGQVFHDGSTIGYMGKYTNPAKNTQHDFVFNKQ